LIVKKYNACIYCLLVGSSSSKYCYESMRIFANRIDLEIRHFMSEDENPTIHFWSTAMQCRVPFIDLTIVDSSTINDDFDDSEQ